MVYYIETLGLPVHSKPRQLNPVIFDKIKTEFQFMLTWDMPILQIPVIVSHPHCTKGLAVFASAWIIDALMHAQSQIVIPSRIYRLLKCIVWQHHIFKN